MHYNISLQRTPHSRLPEVDFANIPFGKVFSDHIFIADFVDGEWTDLRIEPFAPFSMHPANLALHYGQSIFEGMKASKNADGEPLLFRPEQNARRFNTSAHRMCMPPVPEELFLQAIDKLIDLDQKWIPNNAESALYIRPFMFASGEYIGVQASDTYKFMIFTCPVGPYYSKPVKLLVEETYIRAAAGGTGEAKCSANYSASLYPAQLARQKGYDQVMWMDAKEFKYIQEAGTMNFMFVIDNVLVTPATDGCILKGITRDSILTMMRQKGYKTEERPVSIDELVAAYHAGRLQEAFGAGTAAVVAPVSEIRYRELSMILPPVSESKFAKIIKDEINGLRNGTIADTNGWIRKIHVLEENLV